MTFFGQPISGQDTGNYTIFSTKNKLTDAAHCGIINPGYFSINVETFTESISFNSCLNKKVGIDINGDIKNCPTMKNAFGNIFEDKIEEIVRRDEFKSLWSVTKDQITDCKVCEFRHIWIGNANR